MAPIHAKSPCCSASVRRFGKRRRQCINCKRTWSIRQKKRGPKRIRTARPLLARVLVDGYTLAQEARNFPKLGRSGIARRFAEELRRYLAAPPRPLPKGPYTLVVDGVYFKFKRKEWVLYLVALKPASHRMYFLDPTLVQGRERLEVWCAVFGALQNAVQKQIRALVSDGLPGFRELATGRGWAYQRCHFHLLASLVRGKGMRRYRTRGSQLREHVLKAVRVLLADASAQKRTRARSALRRYAGASACPAYVRKHIAELLLREDDFRTYLSHPELKLPTTTSAMESVGRLVRKAARTARTPESLHLRAIAFLRLKRSVVCNGFDTQN